MMLLGRTESSPDITSSWNNRGENYDQLIIIPFCYANFKVFNVFTFIFSVPGIRPCHRDTTRYSRQVGPILINDLYFSQKQLPENIARALSDN